MRLEFFRRYRKAAQNYIPIFYPPSSGTLFARRNVRLAIREAARRGVKVRIVYKKIGDDKATKIYLVDPYAFRFRKTRVGFRKMFFAFDDEKMRHQRGADAKRHKGQGTIKMFVLNQILNTQVTNQKYRRRWAVQIR